MALDTRNKRASAVGFLQPYRGVYPLPSGSSTATVGGRQQTARAYSGIAAGIPVTTSPPLTIDRFDFRQTFTDRMAFDRTATDEVAFNRTITDSIDFWGPL